MKRGDDQLHKLHTLVLGAASAAHMYAYSTSPDMREWLTSRESHELSGFRARAEELSRPYPGLRPMLGRLYLALEELVAQGRHGCLPAETYGNVLFSQANACHGPRCDAQKLVDEVQEAILNLYRQS